MSNQVGKLYRQVIDDVIKETKTEFEESGDDPAVLDMLKQTWRRRLLSMNVTKEPLWGEIHREKPPISHIPGTSSMSENDAGSAMSALGAAQAHHLSVGGDSLGLYGLPSVKELDGNVGHGGLGPPSLPDALRRGPPGAAQQHPLYVKEEFEMMSNPSIPAHPPAGASGSSAAYNPLDSSKLPAKSPGPSSGNVQFSPELRSQIHNAINNGDSQSNSPRVPQTDGPQDEELNSDLDDSEDELNSNDENEDNDQTQIMLCLYEKVHKVKTRWKYVLKDGMANINGYDYVFSRATGESDW